MKVTIAMWQGIQGNLARVAHCVVCAMAKKSKNQRIVIVAMDL